MLQTFSLKWNIINSLKSNWSAKDSLFSLRRCLRRFSRTFRLAKESAIFQSNIINNISYVERDAFEGEREKKLSKNSVIRTIHTTKNWKKKQDDINDEATSSVVHRNSSSAPLGNSIPPRDAAFRRESPAEEGTTSGQRSLQTVERLPHSTTTTTMLATFSTLLLLRETVSWSTTDRRRISLLAAGLEVVAAVDDADFTHDRRRIRGALSLSPSPFQLFRLGIRKRCADSTETNEGKTVSRLVERMHRDAARKSRRFFADFFVKFEIIRRKIIPLFLSNLVPGLRLTVSVAAGIFNWTNTFDWQYWRPNLLTYWQVSIAPLYKALDSRWSFRSRIVISSVHIRTSPRYRTHFRCLSGLPIKWMNWAISNQDSRIISFVKACQT